MTLLALAFAAGIAAGGRLALPALPCLLVSAAMLVALPLTRRRTLPMLLAVVALGAGWTALRQRHVAPDDLSARQGETPHALGVVGTALATPRPVAPTGGSMAAFAHSPPPWTFPLAVEALRDRRGTLHRCRGRVNVRVGDAAPRVRGGDRVEVVGLLHPTGPPRNPGAVDWRPAARSRGEAGLLVVRHATSVRAAPPTRLGPRLLRAREGLQANVRGWLHGSSSATPDRAALLDAMLLGRRDTRFASLSESFRHAGLAHLLAVSGLHLGILAGLVLVLARLDGRPRRVHGLLIIGVALGYLAVVEVRLPVLRAAVMLVAASLGVATGRRINVASLVALSGAMLLAWRPEQLFTAGFQLSFGVVLGLVHLTPTLRRRWFGPPDHSPPSLVATAGQWMRTLGAASVTAWLVATPITLHHFGLLTPLAAPLSVAATPLTAVLLGAGYARTAFGGLLPAVAVVVDVPLQASAAALLGLARAAASVPGAATYLPPPVGWWSIAALGWLVVVTLAPVSVAIRRATWPTALLLAGWLALPLLPRPWGPTLRVDMLDVGDGSCYVLRSGGGTVVFDAGSAHDVDAGARVIVPAIRALGVRRVDAVIVSHANLDHCSAVIEVVDAFRARQVLVTPQLVDAARRDRRSVSATLLRGLRHRSVPWRVVGAGVEARLGRSRWRWLHPSASLESGSVNETSMVIDVTAAGRRVILCGDLEGPAATRLRTTHPRLRADVVELPHHGAADDAARELVCSLRPSVALQSTGRRRWQRDTWGETLRDATRLVTARDGACWVEIARDGAMSWGRYLEEGTEGPRD